MGRTGTRPSSHSPIPVGELGLFTPYEWDGVCRSVWARFLRPCWGVTRSSSVQMFFTSWLLLLMDDSEAARRAPLPSFIWDLFCRRCLCRRRHPAQHRKRDKGDAGREMVPGRLCRVTGMGWSRGADQRVLDQRDGQVQVLLQRQRQRIRGPAPDRLLSLVVQGHVVSGNTIAFCTDYSGCNGQNVWILSWKRQLTWDETNPFNRDWSQWTDNWYFVYICVYFSVRKLW